MPVGAAAAALSEGCWELLLLRPRDGPQADGSHLCPCRGGVVHTRGHLLRISASPRAAAAAGWAGTTQTCCCAVRGYTERDKGPAGYSAALLRTWEAEGKWSWWWSARGCKKSTPCECTGRVAPNELPMRLEQGVVVALCTSAHGAHSSLFFMRVKTAVTCAGLHC